MHEIEYLFEGLSFSPGDEFKTNILQVQWYIVSFANNLMSI